MTEDQIITELEYLIDLTDEGMLKHLRSVYPDKDGRKYKKWIRQAREKRKRKPLEVEPPYELSEEELVVWCRTFELIDRSILEPVDHIVLADYCKEKALYYSYSSQLGDLDNNGIVISKNGQPYQHPLIGMANKKKEICEKTEHKFGFDPSGRRKNKYEKAKKGQSVLKSLMDAGRRKVK